MPRLWFLLFLSIAQLPLNAQTDIFGPLVSGTWPTSGSPYIVRDIITIPATATLIIEPGVTVKFEQLCTKMIINGRLVAEGTVTDSIYFTALDPIDNWNGLRFIDTRLNSLDSSKIAYARIDQGYANCLSNINGGGVYLNNADKVVIRHCLLTDNVAKDKGGAIYSEDSEILIEHSSITDNRTTLFGGIGNSEGGGIFMTQNSNLSEVTLKDALISDNLSKRGGGIYCENSRLLAFGLEVSYNATYSDTNTWRHGAGMVCRGNFIQLADADIHHNSATSGGGLMIYEGNALNFENVNIHDNVALWGGGVTVWNPINDGSPMGNVNIYNNQAIEDGQSGGDGGGVFIFNNPGNQKLVNWNIHNNSASKGGGIYCEERPNYLHLNGLDIHANNAVEGGGIYFLAERLKGFNDCRISNNTADRGAGVFVTRGDAPDWLRNDSINILDLSITDNTASSSGGGIYVDTLNELVFNSNVKISHNSAPRGGGIFVHADSLELVNAKIDSNSAEFGAGIYIDSAAVLLISNAQINDNDADLDGGGIYFNDATEITLQNISIARNEADHGGGIYWANATSLSLDTFDVYMNTALRGGGIYFDGVDFLSLAKPRIYQNAAVYGGGIYADHAASLSLDRPLMYRNTASVAGGAVFTEGTGSPLFIEHGTLALNSAPIGSGIYISDAPSILKFSVDNTILWNIGGAEIGLPSPTNDFWVDVAYSDIRGSWEGTGNIDRYPMFVDTTSNEFHATWPDFPMPDDPLRSPCIDAADPLYGADPDGTRSDMGVYPYEQSFGGTLIGSIRDTLYCSQSPYLVNGDIFVTAGDTLVIEPCVDVVFNGDHVLGVTGTLWAQGNNVDNIRFFPRDTISGWEGIAFNNTNNGQDSSILEHCRIKFAYADGYGENAKGGALYFNNASNIRVQNSLLEKNCANFGGGAVFTNNSAHPLFIDNLFRNNYSPLGGAFYASGSDQLDFNGDEFYGNRADKGGALYLYGADAGLSAVTIRDNYADQFGGGIYLRGGVHPDFDPVNRTNIYRNRAAWRGMDIYHELLAVPQTINIVVDTFTVLEADHHFLYPRNEFVLDRIHGKITQSTGDLYVSAAIGDDNNDGSAAAPLRTLDMALFKTDADATSPRVVHLATGLHSPSATDEKLPLNWRSHVTLSGEDRVGSKLNGEDQHQLITLYGDSGVILKSLTLLNGSANYGGAIYVNEASIAQLDSLNLTHHTSVLEGGAVYCRGNSLLTINDGYAAHNFGGRSGGAFNFGSGSVATFNGGVFEYNSTSPAYSGGAIATGQTDLTLNGTSFFYNQGKEGGAIYAGGSSVLNADSAIFHDNSTTLYDGGAILMTYSTAEINNSEFLRDSARQGGAIYCYNSDLEITRCSFTRNHATSHGGALYSTPALTGDIDVLRCSFTHNHSKQSGGAMYFRGPADLNVTSSLFAKNTAENNGGGIYLLNAIGDLQHLTIADNNTITGSAGGIYSGNSALDITNSILWGNLDQQIEQASGTVQVTWTDIQGGWPGNNGILIDPLFENNVGDNYRLSNISPCIDRGDTLFITTMPQFDLDGAPRLLQSRTDMGAFEFGVYWKGLMSEDWHTATNWSNNLVPDTNTVISIVEGYSFAPTIYGPAYCSALYNSANAILTIKSSGELRIK